MKWNRSLPSGTKDKLFKEAILSHQLEERVNHHFSARGYQRIETPLIEFEEVFDSMEQKNSSRYRFFDEQGRILVLRPDMTLPIGRVISTTGIILPVKLNYSGKIFRVNKGNSGEYNEQLQAGMELIGFDSLKAEMECLTNAIDISQKSGLRDFQLELGHAAIFQTIIQELDLDKKEEATFKWLLQSKNALRIQSFLKDFQDHELFPLISRLPRLFGKVNVLEEISTLTENITILAAVNEMKQLVIHIQRMFPNQEILVDIGAVQEFKYYTGITFKAYTFQSSDSFLSGGRYDNLLSVFSENSVPAVGLVFYLDRMMNSLERNNQLEKTKSIQTLIHFDETSFLEADRLLEMEPSSSLSLYANLEDTFAYAKLWEIPRIIIINQEGRKDIQLEVGEIND